MEHVTHGTIEISLDASTGRLVVSRGGPLHHLLQILTPSVLPQVRAAVLAGHGFGFQGAVGFSFPADRDEDGEEDPGDQVEVYDPFGEIRLPVEDFKRLMMRALALLEG